jgi:hypothetical protein
MEDYPKIYTIDEENRKKMNKSLGDCYTIDELYDLKKGKVYDPAAVATSEIASKNKGKK